MTGPSQRRKMAETAVERRGISIALACRAFRVSETCYRYSPKLRDENEEIADLLTGLADARKTWGFGLCFLHLRNVKGHPWNHKSATVVLARLVKPECQSTWLWRLRIAQKPCAQCNADMRLHRRHFATKGLE